MNEDLIYPDDYFVEDEEIFSDEHEWEYDDETEQMQAQAASDERFARMPKLCQRCRWLDWYYLEDCSYGLMPINGKCEKFCRDYHFVFRLPRPLRLLWWDWQYKLWSLGQKLRGISS